MTIDNDNRDDTPDRMDTTGGMDPSENETSWWTSTWPLHRADWIAVAIALVSVIAVYVAVGELLTNWSVLDGIVQTDKNVAQDLADGRTATKTDLAHWSSFIADTPVKIAASVVIAGLFLWRYRRWHEAVMIGLPLIFEAIAFIVTTYIVQRPRPDVERLLESPVDTSFPSGHVAAATVYAALAIIVFWHTRAVWARSLAVAIAAIASLAVAWARAYQGMHFLSDVIAGVLLGLISIFICAQILGPPPGAVGGMSVNGANVNETTDEGTNVNVSGDTSQNRTREVRS